MAPEGLSATEPVIPSILAHLFKSLADTTESIISEEIVKRQLRPLHAG